MLTIRLARGGSKKRPFYHIVAADVRNRRDGRYNEKLGFFNPVARGKEEGLRFNLERYEQLVAQGAQSTDRIKSLVKQAQKEQSAPQEEASA